MKATFKTGIAGLTGKLDEGIFYFHPKLKRVLVRSFPKMPKLSQNEDYTQISRILGGIKPSEAYKKNFKSYLSILRDDNPELSVANWYNLYVKMMWAMQAQFPEDVDLKALTRSQIQAQSLPCITIKAAVEAGLLPSVTGYEQLVEQI